MLHIVNSSDGFMVFLVRTFECQYHHVLSKLYEKGFLLRKAKNLKDLNMWMMILSINLLMLLLFLSIFNRCFDQYIFMVRILLSDIKQVSAKTSEIGVDIIFLFFLKMVSPFETKNGLKQVLYLSF